MIDFHICSISPNSNILRAYLYQIIWEDFGFTNDIIQKITKQKPEFQNIDMFLWDLYVLNDKDLKSLFSDTNFIPDRFFYFIPPESIDNAQQRHNALNHEETDYRDFPQLFTEIHQVSFDQGGLIGMQLFNHQVYKLYNSKGEELISHCHDLHLGASGLVLFRSSENNGGMWELVSYNEHKLDWESIEQFGSLDSPSDFPDLEDRDQIPIMHKSDEELPFIPSGNETLERDRLLEILEDNDQNYRYLSAYYANDSELAEKAVINNKLAFTLLSADLQNNQKFIERLFSNPSIDKGLYNYIPLEFKRKEEFILHCIEANPRIIKILEPIHSKNLLIKAIEFNLWTALDYASDELKSDLDCIKSAMRMEWKAIRFVPEELISNHEFFTSLLDWYNEDIRTYKSSLEKKKPLHKLEVIQYLSRFNPLAIGHLSPVSDLELIVSSARNLPTADFPKFLDYCADSLKETPEFWLIILKANSNSMHFIPAALLHDYEFVHDATQIHGELLTLVPVNYSNDEELAYQAIHQIVHRRGYCNPEKIIPHIGQELLNNVNFIKRVMIIWPSIVNYLSDSLKNNEELFLYGIQHTHPWLISRASDELQNKLDFVLKALQINENAFDHLSPIMKSNETVQENINAVTRQNYLNSLNTPNCEEEVDDLPF